MKCTTEQFFSIDPDVIVESRALTFDVFVYMPTNERIVLFRLSGDVLEKDRLERMKARGLKNFHVRVEHRAAYQQYLALVEADRLAALRAEHEKKLKEALENQKNEPKLDATPPKVREPEPPKAEPAKPPTQEELKREFTPEVKPEQVMAELLSDDPKDKEKARTEGKKMVDKILSGPPKMDPTMKQIVESPEAEHATTVAVYSVLFAMGLGQKNQMILQDLIISSLMHDIGVTQTPVELLAQPTMQRAPADAKRYESHIELGLGLLQELDYAPNPRVLTIMGQHHEKFNGSGYPQHLESFRIDELAQIVSFSDLLDTVCRGRHDGTERSLPEALVVLSEIEKQTTFPQFFNPDLFKKIMKWLKNASGKDFMKEAVVTVEQTKEKFSKAG